MDILVCKLKYPNDPRGDVKPHQHFVGIYTENSIILYSISSVLGKEYRIFDSNNNVKEEYYLIEDTEQIECSLRVTSFIDCTKAYRIIINENIIFKT